METSSSEQKKVFAKIAMVVPSSYHLKDCLYRGWVQIGSDNYYTYFYSTEEEAYEKLKVLKEIGRAHV